MVYVGLPMKNIKTWVDFPWRTVKEPEGNTVNCTSIIPITITNDIPVIIIIIPRIIPSIEPKNHSNRTPIPIAH